METVCVIEMGYMYLYVMSCRFRDQHRPFRVKEIPRIIIVLLINRNANNRISCNGIF